MSSDTTSGPSDDLFTKDKKGNARYAYKPGWHQCGIDFYNKAVKFLTDICEHQDFGLVQNRAREMQTKELQRRDLNGDSKKKRKYTNVEGGAERDAPLLWDDAPCIFWQYAVQFRKPVNI